MEFFENIKLDVPCGFEETSVSSSCILFVRRVGVSEIASVGFIILIISYWVGMKGGRLNERVHYKEPRSVMPVVVQPCYCHCVTAPLFDLQSFCRLEEAIHRHTVAIFFQRRATFGLLMVVEMGRVV